MNNKKIILPLIALSASLGANGAEKTKEANKKPNIVIILADDIAYGDFGCYGAELIKTPNIDKLAENGVLFDNAFAPASTSTPSRYALLTGEYAWRKRVGILSGSARMSIDTTKITLPIMMQSMGYKTAAVGKWHLGLGDGSKPLDYNEKIDKSGVRSVGFDYSFIYPATNDRVPTIYMENDLTVGLDKDDPIEVSYAKKVGDEPTGKEFPDMVRLKPINSHDGTIVNGIGRIGWMSGGKDARWRDEDLSDEMLSKAQQFIKSYDETTPFFLYYSTHTAHAPRVSNERFIGQSKAGHYGDIIEEFDYCVGGIIKALEEKGALDNTIVIVTSDNGGVIQTGYYDGCKENIGSHDPFRGLRGHKGSLYEGGAKVPFVVSWGDGLKKSFVQNQRFCYVDMLSTIADLTSFNLTDEMKKDGYSAKELLYKKKANQYRPYTLTQDNSGSIAVRYGDWKYIHVTKRSKAKNELYNLTNDPYEKENLVDNPDSKKILSEFTQYLEEMGYNL